MSTCNYISFPVISALTSVMLALQGGADYFSSGETYAYSDGEASSGGSPDSSPHSSGSESERDVFF
jgi:hypothetical protein